MGGSTAGRLQGKSYASFEISSCPELLQRGLGALVLECGWLDGLNRQRDSIRSWVRDGGGSLDLLYLIAVSGSRGCPLPAMSGPLIAFRRARLAATQQYDRCESSRSAEHLAVTPRVIELLIKAVSMFSNEGEPPWVSVRPYPDPPSPAWENIMRSPGPKIRVMMSGVLWIR